MMDVEKLIERLKQHGVACVRTHGRHCSICDEAATALSTLQGENSQLRDSRDHWKRLAHELSEGVNGKDAEHERLHAENEKLRDELEQVKADLDRYRSHVERLSPLPDCNTCDSRDCTYRPKIGAFTRINCPLWRGKKGN